MINQDERPGYGYQLKQGATSLAEAWDANHNASHNHFMLGHITEWFYSHLVGIQSDLTKPGFKKIIIAPAPVDHLKWAEAKYESLHGPIFVHWERENQRFTLQVRIPANTTAIVHVPASVESAIYESDQPVDKVAGVRLLQRKNHKAVFEIESGEYRLQSTL